MAYKLGQQLISNINGKGITTASQIDVDDNGKTQAQFNTNVGFRLTNIENNTKTYFFDGVIKEYVEIYTAETVTESLGWTKLDGVYYSASNSKGAPRFVRKWKAPTPADEEEKIVFQTEVGDLFQTKLYVCGNMAYVWNGTELVEVGNDLTPYALTANVENEELLEVRGGIEVYNSTLSGYSKVGYCYDTLNKKFVAKYTNKFNSADHIYKDTTDFTPLTTKIYHCDGKAYFWNSTESDLVAMASDTELQKMRARSGDYTLDFNLYAEQVSEVVMFKRTIGELHLINVETIRCQINDSTVAEIPLRDETTDEEAGEVTYGDLKTSLEGDELITLNSALNSETTPFRLTWTITRTTAGQPAAIGVLYKETDTMA